MSYTSEGILKVMVSECEWRTL